MLWRAFIHYKNDEEDEGNVRSSWVAAWSDLCVLLKAAEEKGEVEDIQYAQIEPVN